jgi:hypothetical protein
VVVAQVDERVVRHGDDPFAKAGLVSPGPAEEWGAAPRPVLKW